LFSIPILCLTNFCLRHSPLFKRNSGFQGFICKVKMETISTESRSLSTVLLKIPNLYDC
jgi:hypothetical protein